MNLQFRLPPRMADLAVSHAVTAYDPGSDELLREFEVPPGLDSLARKIAEVEEDDPSGALSYPLVESQLTAFRFIFGLRPLLTNAEFFFEPWHRQAERLHPRTTRLFADLNDVGLGRPQRNISERINERELAIPTLRLLAKSPTDFLTTTDLKSQLTEILRPVGTDAKLLASRSDTHFAQKVRNMVSNRFQPYSFIKKGYAVYVSAQRGLRITERGHELLRHLDWYGRTKRH